MTDRCEVCEKFIEPPRGNRRKYCSSECSYRSRARRNGRRQMLPALQKGWVDATYFSVHARLQKAFGSASSRSCANCGAQAKDWAYDNSDPQERTDPKNGLRFSADLDRYSPLCGRCHRRMDDAAKNRAACGTEAGYYHHRRIAITTPCQPCKTAHSEASKRRTENHVLTEWEPQP